MPKPTLLKHSSHFSKAHIAIVSIIFAVVGGTILVSSFAANPNLPGDINNDNKVDITDVSILLSNYGTTNATADVNSDGIVNITDMSIVLSHYGQSYTVSPTVVSQTIVSGSTVSGTITWIATTSNDSNVNTVDFYLDGVFRNTEASAPYASSDPPQTDEGLVDTTKLSNGSHTFKAVANLKDGTTATNSVTATVNNSVSALTCTKYASPTGNDSGAGTLTSPYLTPQKLIDNLTAGQTGCMRQGTYKITTFTNEVGIFISRAGTASSPITLTSYPGERATVTSDLHLPEVILVHEGADNITLTNFNVVATDPIASNAKLAGKNLIVSGMDMTTNNTGNNCLYFGDGTAIVENAHIFNNRIHECGNPIHGNQDHCIYAHTLLGGYIKNNFLYNCSGYAIQLYPDSHGVLFDHNTIDGGSISVRGGLVFGSDTNFVSTNNTVTNNIVTYAAVYGISGSWGGLVGTGNVANDNCLFSAVVSVSGFTASGNITATADPFNNRAAHDYSVKSSSVCAGKGAS